MDGKLAWFACITGTMGAMLLALNIGISPLGYIFFTLSSLSLLAVAVAGDYPALFYMQTVFTIINLVGIVRWLL